MKNIGLVESGWLCVVAVIFVLTSSAQDTDRDPFPPPGTTGNAENVPHIGGVDANGNPVRLAKATGHVSNYDEGKVRAYSLPNPLKMADGRTVTSPELWKERRSQILEFYETHIYGRVPANAPDISWRLVGTDDDSVQYIEGRVGDDPSGPKIHLTLHLPEKVDHPVPVFLNLSFFRGDTLDSPARQRSTENPERFDQRAEVLNRGWAYAQIGYGDIQPDRADQWREGVIGATLSETQTQPAADEWGTISTWAWGASRTIDHLESLTSIDSNKIAITGASRLGKTALWAAAKDERIAAVFSVVPGEMGASLIRRD